MGRMVDRKQLTVWVSPEQIENWDEYQEELGFQNRAEMIRRSVEYYYREQTQEEEGSGRVVDERLDDIVDRIDRVKADINDVRREQINKSDMDEVAEEVAYRLTEVLESDLMETLPEDYRDELESEIEDLDEKME